MSYAGLAVVFVAAAAVVAALVSWRRRLGAAWWATTGLTIAALVVLTVVFDSLMIGMDLFRYDDEQLVGWFIGLAPIEDLAWPIAAGLLLPSLGELLAGRGPDRSPPAGRGDDDERRRP